MGLSTTSVALTGVVDLAAVEHAIESRFSGPVAAGNVAAARACFEHVGSAMGVSAGA